MKFGRNNCRTVSKDKVVYNLIVIFKLDKIISGLELF